MRRKKIKTPIILQMESTDCGAVALNIIFEYYGIEATIEELRIQLCINRDGCKASKLIEVSKDYGCNANAYMIGINELKKMDCPCIIYWKFNHFVVYEYCHNNKVFINDPAEGRKNVSIEEFSECFTGLAFVIKPLKKSKYRINNKIRFAKEIICKYRDYKKDFLNILLITSISVIFTSIVPLFFSYVFDKLFTYNVIMIYYFVFLVVCSLGQYITFIIQEYFLTIIQEKITINTTNEFFYHILKMELNSYNQRSASDLAGRFETNIKLCDFISKDMSLIIVNSISLCINILVIVFINVYLGMFELLSVIVSVFFIIKISSNLFSMELQNQTSQCRMLGSVYSGINIIQTIKASGIKDKYVRRIIGYYVNYFESKKKKDAIDKCVIAIQDLLSNINKIVFIIIGGILIMTNHFTFGKLLACNMLISNIIRLLKQFMDFEKKYQFSKCYLYRINDIMNQVPESKPVNKNNIYLDGMIDIRNLSFGYTKESNTLINNCNIHINERDFVAIIGKIGCGKSTLIKLLLGLYKPWAGEILYDKNLIENIDDEYFSKYLCCTGQNSVIFEGSIKDNITLWNNTIDDFEIMKILEIVELLDFVNLYGLEYRLEENGLNISGGEKEKICIARVLINKPKILIFDESTRSLDTFSEKRIISKIRELNVTIILISHRIETINLANRILYIDEGNIHEYSNLYEDEKLLEVLLNY